MKHWLLGATLLFFAGAAHASEPVPVPADGDEDEILIEDDKNTVRVGAALAYMPEYSGSSEQMFRVLPLVSFSDIAGFEFNGLSLSYPLVNIGTGTGPGKWSLKAGPRAGFEFGRDSEDSETLTGFEDIDPSLLLGGAARLTVGVLGFRVDAGQDVIGGHDGFTADVSVGTYIPPGLLVDKLSFQPALTLSWADGNYNQTLYGVTEAQALASGLPETPLDAGFHRASATLLGWYDLSDRVQLSAIVSYREYLGDYRDSPILRAPDGATNDVFATMGVSYKFSL